MKTEEKEYKSETESEEEDAVTTVSMLTKERVRELMSSLDVHERMDMDVEEVYPLPISE